ncbi:MAG: type II toxin-antitoxin system RatA family toxin [Halodesulfurarchaeum sp.]
MNRIEGSRRVDQSPEAVFGAVRDFSGYTDYSDYLRAVTVDGDGDRGTEYVLDIRVLGLTVDVRTRLDELDPPRRIEWSVLGDVEAAGQWNVRPIEGGNGSTLELIVEYDPESVDSSVVSLPFGLSVARLTSKAESLAEREAETVLDRLVADVEQGMD